MDLGPTPLSYSETHDRSMKSDRDYLLWSKRLFLFVILAIILNVVLTYRLIFHPPLPCVARCTEFVEARRPELASPVAANISESTGLSLYTDLIGVQEEGGKPEIDVSLHNDVVVEYQIEKNALAVRFPSEFGTDL